MHDVLVLGGGPAGASAAISCAAKGLNVVLIEAARFPRHRPGETLHPGVEPILTQLGVGDEVRLAGFIRHEGIHVQWGGPIVFQPYGRDRRGPWLGYQAWRSEFDTILIGRAVKLGVRVLQPCIAEKPIVEGGRVIGVVTGNAEIRARFVLDGTGSVSWLARRLGLRRRLRSRRLIAHYGYTGPTADPVSDLPMLRQNANGWTWIARVQPDRYHWTTLSIERCNTAPDAPVELSFAAPSGPVRSADVTWAETLQPAGPGYFILGDAATVVDPLSSHGVLKALISGIWSAHLIGHIQHGLSERSAAAVYASWTQRWFHHDSKILTRYYRNAGLEFPG